MNLRICWLVILMTSKPQFGGEKVKLGDVCTLVLGQSPISSTCNACGQGLPFFQGNADFGRINPEATSWCTEPKKIAEPGDILLSVRAPIGAVNIALEKCCIGRGVAAIRPNSRIIQTDYLKHVLVSYRSQLETKGTGSTFKAVGKKVLSEFEIPICSLNGQSQIENQLNQILDCIENCKMEIEQLDQLVKSRFVEMFGDPTKNQKSWEFGTVESLSINLDSRRVPITQADRVPGPYPYYGASGIVDYVADFIFEEPLLLISEDGANLLARTLPIAFSICGKTWVNNHAHILKCHNEAGRIYLETLINILDISSYVTGSAQPKLNQKQLNSIPIMLPPLELQQEFADFVAQVDKSEFA